uniref:Uncharacterized protein n=1 Tax=Peronospora matthiolae TaxID=2874970 RepID=A0AAV1UL13_9STRA
MDGGAPWTKSRGFPGHSLPPHGRPRVTTTAMTCAPAPPLSSSRKSDRDRATETLAAAAATCCASRSRVYPQERLRLEQEVAALDQLEQRIESENTTDFRLGRALLLATRQERVVKAQSALKRRRAAAHHVWTYASGQAREVYARRCGELQRAMNADIERELRRLQTAKDGVSVTSRRRRAVQDDGRRSGAAVVRAKSGLGVRRRRTMYTSEEDEEDERQEKALWEATSCEEQTYRAQLQEKKQLERLLSSAAVFQPVVKHVTAKEVAEDLELIQSAIARQREQVEMKGGTKQAKKRQLHHVKKTKEVEKKKTKPPRRMTGTPRDGRHALRLDSPASVTTGHRKKVNTTATCRRSRLHYNPSMLQEGQEVDVLKRRHAKEAADSGGRESQDECVLSGTITAATATQVYVLTASGRFESFDVRDCVRGTLYVRAAEKRKSLSYSVKEELDAGSALEYISR